MKELQNEALLRTLPHHGRMASLDWSKRLRRELGSRDSDQLMLNPAPIPPTGFALESTHTLAAPLFSALAGR